MDVEFGNAGDLFTNGTGWFIGFSEWNKIDAGGRSALRFLPKEQRSHSLSVKWMFHPSGDDRGVAKPPSQGRTLSMLVSEKGVFRVQFSEDPEFPTGLTTEFRLGRHGDFALWGERLHHRWFVDADCTILTFRWIPN